MLSVPRSHSLFRVLAAALAALAWALPSPGYSHAMASPREAGPEAVPGESFCAECGMRVTAESPFASQIKLDNGKAVFFCDLGDMFLYYGRHEGDSGAVAVFVKDYASGEWVDGRSAFYLTGAKVRTPMRYGILAFGDRGAAEKFMRDSGGEKVLTFGQAVAGRVWEE